MAKAIGKKKFLHEKVGPLQQVGEKKVPCVVETPPDRKLPRRRTRHELSKARKNPCLTGRAMKMKSADGPGERKRGGEKKYNLRGKGRSQWGVV